MVFTQPTRFEVSCNNYMMGARIRLTPVDKIVSTTRIDRYHTLVTYEFTTSSEVELTEKILSKKLHKIF